MFKSARYHQTADHWLYLNKGEEDELQICCFRKSAIKIIVTYLLILLTGGIAALVFHWFPHWYLFATCYRCSVGTAEKILIKETFRGQHATHHVKPLKILTSESLSRCRSDCQNLAQVTWGESIPKFLVHFDDGAVREEVETLRMFTYKKVTYIWHSRKHEFVKLKCLDDGVPTDVLHRNKELTIQEQFIRRVVYGPNKLAIKIQSVVTLFFMELLHPFYVFQIGSFILWIIDEYYIYPVVMIITSLLGISLTVSQTCKNQRKLKSMVTSSDYCTILRETPQNLGYEQETVSTELLVPGDILVIPPQGCIMHCDAVLLAGSCILDESLLTGEAVPVTKTVLPNVPHLVYNVKEHSKHTLFCGTKVIQTRTTENEKVLAIVMKTGFSTTKGSLIRGILYPAPVDFRFERDSYKFIVLLAGIAIIGFIYSVLVKMKQEVPMIDIIFETIDLLPIVVPAALPAAMTVGRFYAQIRLKGQKIHCISPRSINVAGSIDCVCFDKTGTLTESNLDLRYIVPADGKSFNTPITKVSSIQDDNLMCGLVACNSLTIINGEVVGNWLDLKLFESTQWAIEDCTVNEKDKFVQVFKPQKKSDFKIGVVREFPFTSSSKRMGVITQKSGSQCFDYYCKGSPQLVINFVKKELIPFNFNDTLESYTKEGYRVIALTHKTLNMSYQQVREIQREDIEQDLTLIGLIVLENRLKPESAPSIQALNEAQIRVIMVTGDNLLTALSVSRSCNILTSGENVVVVKTDQNTHLKLNYTISNNPKKGTSQDYSDSDSVDNLDTMENQKQCLTHNNKFQEEEGGNAQNIYYNNYRFAMTGKEWEVVKEYHSDLLPSLLARGSVFAEMLPEQKQQLVEELMKLGYCVAMCGDGENDCGALKTSHIGISLSEAESSIAAAFTSCNANISCVLNVIREGRAALTTSFGIFKYMAAYSLCTFISVLILYSVDSNLTTWEYLYIDLFIIANFAIFFGKNRAYEGQLATKPPLSSLISVCPILSLLLQTCLITGVQLGAFMYLKSQSWYKEYDTSHLEDRFDVDCHENFVIFIVTSFQCITLAIVFSKGKPYRKSVFSNYGFLIAMLMTISFTVYLTLWPGQFFIDWLELDVPEDFTFRVGLLFIAVVHFILSIFIEEIFINDFVAKMLRFKLKNFCQKKEYVAIESDFKSDTKFPICDRDYITDIITKK